MRAAKDYDAEAARLKGELQALQDELKCTTLIQHAEDSVEAYSGSSRTSGSRRACRSRSSGSTSIM